MLEAVGFGKRTNRSGIHFLDNDSQGIRTPKLRAFIGSIALIQARSA